MKFKGTWILFFVVLLISAYAYFFDYRKEIKETEQKEKSSQLVDFKAEQINKIEIKNTKDTTILTRSADGWKLESPIKDWADNSNVDEFVESLSKEKYLEVVKEGEGIDWNLFGLQAPQGTLTIYNQSGSKQTFLISTKKNFEGNVYLRKENSNQVLIGTPAWLTRAEKVPFDFRDKRIFRSKIASINKVELQSLKDKFIIEMKDNTWISPKFVDWKLDQNKIRELITQISELKALEFLSDGSDIKKAKSKVGLDKAIVKIKLTLSDKTWSVDIIKNKDNNYYSYSSQPEVVAKIQPGQLDKITQSTFVEFRDKKAPFSFDKQAVKKIEIKTKDRNMIFKLNGSNWELAHGAKDQVPNQDKVKSLLDKLKNLEVGQFTVTKKKNSGDKNEIKFSTDKDQVELELAWDKVESLKTPEGDKKMVLATTNHFSEPFYIEEKNVDELSLNELVHSANQAKPTSQDVKK